MAKVSKKAGEQPQGVVIQNITVRPVVRSSQDIEKWRNALQSAEAINPIRVPLYDLYADLLLDTVLSSNMGKRIRGVTRVPLVFLDKSGKEVPAMEELIKLQQFRKLRKEVQKQKIWGITVVELSIKNGQFHVFSVPRKHIKPHLGRITFEQYGVDGYDYRQPPYNRYLVQIGEDNDLGLLLKAAPYVIYKRGGFGDWAHFAEIFGMPFREARYDGYNNEVRAQLETALEQAGSAAYAILPKEAEITFHDSKSTQGSTDLYNTLRKACNEELCILMLGQTETTISSASSGYAQSKTHAEVEEGLNEDDREDELAIFNEQILPILANLGYPVEGGHFAHKLPEKSLSKKDKAELVVKLKKEAGLPIDDDYMYKEFGIPKPANYKELKEEHQKPAPIPTPPPPQEQEPPKSTGTKKEGKGKNSGNLSRWEKLRLMLADFFDPAPGN